MEALRWRGPTEAFKETAARLLECGGAVQVSNAGQLEHEIARLTGDRGARAALGTTARCFVQSQQGATVRTLDGLDTVLTRKQVQRQAA